uniref:DUF4154 domain-containing protein n=1 Tax=Geobacter sp. (strain M21) TaxID=443144 RepID=C6E7Z6_GEOSM
MRGHCPIPAAAGLRRLILLALLFVHPFETRAEGAQQYQVKAAMVVNMSKYIEWPAEAFPRTGAPLQICSVGRGPFAAALEQYQGKTVLGHQLSLRRLAVGDEPAECHVLVVSGVEKRYLAGVLDQARRRDALTVGDIPDFARFGGIIGFVENEGRVRFVINLKAAQQSRVRISSQLLKLAKLIREGDQ